MSKNTKIFSFILCIIFTFMFFCNVLISSDIEHILTCEEDHCEECIVIQTALNNLKNILNIVILLFIFTFIYFYEKKLKSSIVYFVHNTLINSKVQFNN